MLFKGGRKADEYEDYLSNNGGARNACTMSEHTCFTFNINKNALRGALKRFAQFFVSPLFALEAIDTEVKLVDEEFESRLNEDTCRLEQIQRNTSVDGHPFNRFAWGNKESLYGASKNKKELRKHIQKLRKHIQKIHREGYHSAAMKLVVIGEESLDTLEGWVHKFFGPIKKKNVNPVVRENRKIWKDGKIYWLEAVQDVQLLHLTWVLPPLWPMYLEKGEEYLSYCLGHEGKGSLLYFLKGRGWVTSVLAGVGESELDTSSLASLFSMRIHLTVLGLEKINEIIGLVYQYIKLLRDNEPQEWIFKELQVSNENQFQSMDLKSNTAYAEELAAGLLVYPPTHVIYGKFLYDEWSPDLIKYLLTSFCPNNMRVDIVTKQLKTCGVETERWFKSPYVVEDIAPHLLDLWNNTEETDVNLHLPVKSDEETDGNLHLPVKNDFLQSDLSRSLEKASSDSENSQLQRIVDDSFMRIWYKQDKKVSQVHTFFNITLKEGCGDLKKALLASLLVHLVKDELGPTISQAELAGELSILPSLKDHQLELQFIGQKESVMLFLRKVLEAKKSCLPRIDRFEVIKREMERTLKNENLNPSKHSTYLLSEVLYQNFWDVEEKLRSLEGLTFPNLEAFIPELLSQLYVEGFCHGNFSKEEALHISNLFGNIFPVEKGPSVLSERRHKAKFLSLPTRVELIRDVRVKYENERNSKVQVYFQIQPKPKGAVSLVKLRAVTELVYEILKVKFEESLRSKGSCYVVECEAHKNHCMMGISFCALSAECGPVDLQQKIDAFVEKSEQILKGFTEDNLEKEKDYLRADLLNKDSTFNSESDRLWSYITNGRSNFDLEKKVAEELKLKKKVAEEVRTIKKIDLVKWWETYLGKTSQMRRKLSIRVWGCNTKGKDIDLPEAPDHFIKERTKKRSRSGSTHPVYKVLKTKLTDFKKNGSWLDNS